MSYRANNPNFLEFWAKMAKMTLKFMVNDLCVQYQLRESQDTCLVQIWWFYPKSVMSNCADKPSFLDVWAKMAKMTLKVKVNDLHFQYQPRVSQNARLAQIWWFQLKPVMSCHANNAKFTDGWKIRRMDGQTDRCRQWKYPFGLKGQEVKAYHGKLQKSMEHDKIAWPWLFWIAICSMVLCIIQPNFRLIPESLKEVLR